MVQREGHRARPAVPARNRPRSREVPHRPRAHHPNLLKPVDSRRVSDKELSALIAHDLLIPFVHKTTHHEFRKVHLLLGLRNGVDTVEDSMAVIAANIAELVAVEGRSRK